jgi:hypothetical protein
MRRQVRLTFAAGGIMARREVVEVTCDRCKRTETQKPGLIAARDKMTHEFTLNLHGEQVQYEDLCKSCRKTLKNYADKIMKVPVEKKEEEAEAKVVPVPAPDKEEPKKGGLFSRSAAAG